MGRVRAVVASELPDGPSVPRVVQGFWAVKDRRRSMQRMRDRYGSAFTLDIPMFGRAVVVSDPAEVRELFMSSSDVFGLAEPNLGLVLGSGSLFARDGADHRRQRKLLLLPFNGRRLAGYEAIIEEEAVKEMASWPQAQDFAVMDSMMHITLNAILRAVLGAEGEEFEELRDVMPELVELGSFLVGVPVPRLDLFGLAPWGRFRRLRSRYDAIIERLIAKALADDALAERGDVLAMMLQSTYDDGTRLTTSEIADELLTMLAAGHETTATTLAWAVERLRRHPEILARLETEMAAGGSELRGATITEVQRVRPVIDLVSRRAMVDGARLGRWTFGRGQTVLVSILLMHENDDLFPDAHRFDPDRFMGARADTYAWIPFGGGVRRCIGAAFAQMEMNVVLRTLLRDFVLEPTSDRDEAWRSRGIAWCPKDGGRAVVRRRDAPLVAAGPVTEDVDTSA